MFSPSSAPPRSPTPPTVSRPPLVPSQRVNSLSSRYHTFCDTNPTTNAITPVPPHDRSTTTSRTLLTSGPCGHDIRHSGGPDEGHIPDHNNTSIDLDRPTNHDWQTDMDSSLKCCCGRNDCAYLEHNQVALESLERDLEKAAKLGQALLSRHESYVAETQLENDQLNAKIAALEDERSSLQNANEKVVAENRSLLTKLDTVNKSYTESDETVKNLEALLRDTELEVRRLNALARRAEELETQVHDMERERTQMAQKLTESDQESKSALTRWRESEKRLRILEMELEKIEWEARREMDHHEEIVARLERERILERELGGAEGRLKGAAAMQGINAGQNDNVVSHFVRDILQDNATLQGGIAELRELLQSSNEEVQNLRQQIMHHQPITEDDDQQGTAPLPLDQQVGWEPPASPHVQRDVHVHHHYHAKLAAKANRTPTVRKRAVRRTMMTGMISTPESSIPSTPSSRPRRYASSPVAPLHLHQPIPRKNNRWSVQSRATMSSDFSSLPSSPRSYFDRYSSIFDRIEPGEESSRPTSPESVAVLGSPNPMHISKRPDRKESIPEHSISDDNWSPLTPPIQSPENENTPVTILKPASSQEVTPKPSQILTPTPSEPINIKPRRVPTPTSSLLSTISSPPLVEPLAPETQSVPEHQIPDHDTPSPAASSFSVEDAEAEAGQEDAHITLPQNKTPVPAAAAHTEADPPFSQIEIRPTLRHSTSHDSLVSISGMDIHIAKRPSPPSFSRSYFTPSHLPASTMSSLTTASKQPLTAVASVAASASQFHTLTSTRGHGEGRRGLEVMMAGNSPSLKQNRQTSLDSASSTHSGGSSNTNTPTVAGRLGGWMRSRWGVAPTKSIGDLRSASAGYAADGSRSPNRKRPALATLLEAPPVPKVVAEVPQITTETMTPALGSTPTDSAQLPGSAAAHSPPRTIASSSSSKSDQQTTANSRAFSANSLASSSISANDSLNANMFLRRMPGINQKGPIPGFFLQQRAPSQVEVDQRRVSWEGLRDALG